MSNGKIVLRTAASTNRRLPLLGASSSSKGAMVGEVAGSTAAECVAVCCCCPCGLAVNVVVMAFYKLPYGICRRVLRMRRRRKKVKDSGGMLPPLPPPPIFSDDSSDLKQLNSSFEKPDKEALALEKEMWERFYSTGFWRSSSRREPFQSLANNVDCLKERC